MRTRKRENVAKTAGVALHAVARHMLDNNLPAPISLEGPSPVLGEDAIRVYLMQTHVDDWLETIDVDEETVTPAVQVGHERVWYTGRLPNGVRVSIRFNRRTVAHLKAVGS